MLALTILLGLCIPNVLAITRIIASFREPKFRPVAGVLRMLHSWMRDYIDKYMAIANRSSSYGVWELLGPSIFEPERTISYLCFFCVPVGVIAIVRIFPALVLRSRVVPEILYSKYQWDLFQYRHSQYVNIKWNAVLFGLDILRFALVPAWIILATCIVGFLVLQDAFVWILKSLLKLLRCQD